MNPHKDIQARFFDYSKYSDSCDTSHCLEGYFKNGNESKVFKTGEKYRMDIADVKNCHVYSYYIQYTGTSFAISNSLMSLGEPDTVTPFKSFGSMPVLTFKRSPGNNNELQFFVKPMGEGSAAELTGVSPTKLCHCSAQTG